MPKLPLRTYWATTDNTTARLYQGHVIDVLDRMPAESVQMVVTSPPYFKQRSYSDDPREIGKEETVEGYVLALGAVFDAVRRVLRDDGTLWLNLGPKYIDGTTTGVEWKVAEALRSFGWRLIQEIIWHKVDGMPQGVKTRFVHHHEYLFLLAKSQDYYFDSDAFGGKSKRSVWAIAHGTGYDGAHFAPFPSALVEPCVLAGSSEYGCCADCGSPYRRLVEKRQLYRERPNDFVKRTGEEGTGNSCPNSVAGVETMTVGWEPTCECDTEEVVPCMVLDCFCGSGTSLCVAIQHGRRGVGIDLSEVYLRDCAIPRIEGTLLSIPAKAALIGRKVERLDAGVEI